MKIKEAATPAEIEEVRSLFREYEKHLGVDLTFQGFAQELAQLPGDYRPPHGALLLGISGDKIAGCVAVRKLTDENCEMKRLFVKPGARGAGMGKRLVREAIAAAAHLGYATLRLDTLERLEEAMKLYEELGFHRIAPYYHNPLPGVVYWELKLSGRSLAAEHVSADREPK